MSKETEALKTNVFNHPEGKKAFHQAGKRVLRRLAQALGLEAGTYDLRSEQGGMAVFGEVTLHGEGVYVQVSQIFGEPRVLARSCKGRQDYTGGPNKYLDLFVVCA